MLFDDGMSNNELSMTKEVKFRETVVLEFAELIVWMRSVDEAIEAFKHFQNRRVVEGL